MKFVIAVGIVTSVLALDERVQAVPTTFNVGGIITEVSDDAHSLPPGVQTGSSWGGAYTFDSEASDLYPSDGAFGRYPMTGGNIQLNVASTPFLADGSQFAITVGNDFYGDDEYSVHSSGGTLLPWSSLFTNEVGFALYDSTRSAFSADAIPVSPPGLSSFQQSSFWLNGYDSTWHSFSISGTITYLTPEPACLVMLACMNMLLPRGGSRTKSRRLNAC